MVSYVCSLPATPVVFVFDSTSANYVASSSVHAKSQPVLSEFANVINTICVSILNIQYSHVHSHNLHPFNDYVDSICTHIKNRFQHTPLVVGPIGIELIRSADHYCAHLCGGVAQQLFLGGEACLTQLASIEPKCVGRIIDGDGMTPLEAVHDGLYTREVKCVQHNICTGSPVNRSTLAVGMICNHVFCMFVQEGRSRSSGIFMFEGILVCRSQGLQGQYGCEVWINPNVVVASRFDRKFKVTEENLSILSAKPRSIVVSLSLGPISCSLVSLHAPHATSPQFTSWWDGYSELWDVATNNSEHVLCGADLNYAFSRHDSHSCLGEVKNVGKSLRCPISSRVMTEVSACGCKVASSFEELCRQEYVASPYTYCTKDVSSYSCIDHFLVGGGISTSRKSINHICPLLLFTLNDHFPISGFFTIPPSFVDKGLGSCRSVPHDVKRVGDPVCDAKFLAALSAAPAVPLMFEPTSHCRLLEEIVVGAACDAYPLKKIGRSRSGLATFLLSF